MKQLRNFDVSDEARNDVSDDELLDGVMGKYRGKSEDELVSELYKAVALAKEDGSFDKNSLIEFYGLVSPHLSEQSCEKLHRLIELISAEE